MFDLITFPKSDTVELYTGNGDDHYEIEDWLIDNRCLFTGDPLSMWHSWQFPDTETKDLFVTRWI